jgi:hypothetical protein
MTRPARVLFAMFQGGGNIPFILMVVTRLVACGHQVRIVAGPGVHANRLPVIRDRHDHDSDTLRSPGFQSRVDAR